MKMPALADRNLRVLLGGQTMNMLGSTAMVIVLGIWVKDLTGSSGAAGLIFLLLAATGFLAPLAGLMVDRFPRRTVLVVNDCVTGIVVLLLIFVHSRHQVWLIYLVTAVYGYSGLVYRAARGGLLHSMVADELLGEVNGLISSLGQGMRIIGPLIGAGVYAAWGGGVVAVADTGTFVISVASYLALRQAPDLVRQAPATSKASGPDELASSFFRDLFAGIRHTFANPIIRRMIVASTVAFAGAGMIDVAMFSMVNQGLHRPTSWIGVLASIQGAGSVAAGLIVGPLMRRIGEYSTACIGFLLNGAGLAAASTSVLSATVAGYVLLGVGLPLVVVAELTLVQRHTPAELQGRVLSATDAIINTPFAIAIAVAAGIVGAVGFRPIYLAVAAGFTVVGLALLPYLKVTAPARTEPAEPASVAQT